jgi:hypothetical protein
MKKPSIAGAVKGLPKAEPPVEPIAPEARDVVRQTIYMPHGVHDQVRDLAYTKRCSQQEIFRRALDMPFASEGMKSWDKFK